MSNNNELKQELPKGFVADCKRMIFFSLPLVLVLMGDMQFRYWNLNGEILPFNKLEKTSGTLFVTVRSSEVSRGGLGTQLGILKDNEKICCFRIRGSQVWDGEEGREVDIYWQRSVNTLAKLNDQRYVLQMDVYKENGEFDFSTITYDQALDRYQWQYLDDTLPAFWWYFSAFLFFLYGFYFNYKLRHK